MLKISPAPSLALSVTATASPSFDSTARADEPLLSSELCLSTVALSVGVAKEVAVVRVREAVPLYQDEAVSLYERIVNKKRFEVGVDLTTTCQLFKTAWELPEQRGLVLCSRVVRHLKKVLPKRKVKKKKKTGRPTRKQRKTRPAAKSVAVPSVSKNSPHHSDAQALVNNLRNAVFEELKATRRTIVVSTEASPRARGKVLDASVAASSEAVAGDVTTTLSSLEVDDTMRLPIQVRTGEHQIDVAMEVTPMEEAVAGRPQLAHLRRPSVVQASASKLTRFSAATSPRMPVPSVGGAAMSVLDIVSLAKVAAAVAKKAARKRLEELAEAKQSEGWQQPAGECPQLDVKTTAIVPIVSGARVGFVEQMELQLDGDNVDYSADMQAFDEMLLAESGLEEAFEDSDTQRGDWLKRRHSDTDVEALAKSKAQTAPRKVVAKWRAQRASKQLVESALEREGTDNYRRFEDKRGHVAKILVKRGGRIRKKVLFALKMLGYSEIEPMSVPRVAAPLTPASMGTFFAEPTPPASQHVSDVMSLSVVSELREEEHMRTFSPAPKKKKKKHKVKVRKKKRKKVDRFRENGILYREEASRIFTHFSNKKRYTKGVSLGKVCAVMKVAWELPEQNGLILASRVVRHFRQVLPSDGGLLSKKKRKDAEMARLKQAAKDKLRRQRRKSRTRKSVSKSRVSTVETPKPPPQRPRSHSMRSHLMFRGGAPPKQKHIRAVTELKPRRTSMRPVLTLSTPIAADSLASSFVLPSPKLKGAKIVSSQLLEAPMFAPPLLESDAERDTPRTVARVLRIEKPSASQLQAKAWDALIVADRNRCLPFDPMTPLDTAKTLRMAVADFDVASRLDHMDAEDERENSVSMSMSYFEVEVSVSRSLAPSELREDSASQTDTTHLRLVDRTFVSPSEL